MLHLSIKSRELKTAIGYEPSTRNSLTIGRISSNAAATFSDQYALPNRIKKHKPIFQEGWTRFNTGQANFMLGKWRKNLNKAPARSCAEINKEFYHYHFEESFHDQSQETSGIFRVIFNIAM
jgi:hypothetical protein